MKVVFLGTGTFAVPILEAIAAETDWDILGVLGEEASPVGQKARELGLKLLESQEEVLKESADIIITADYGRIIPAEIFNTPPFKTVNIHPSLLPEYRGPSPIQWALLEGRTETGVTLMLIDEELDHGPILSQEKVPIAPDDTYDTLESKLAHIGAEMLIRNLPRCALGELKPKEQDHRKATYTKKITKEDGHIDWSQSAEQIYNNWRAFVGWPGIFSFAKKNNRNIRLNLIQINLVTPLLSKKVTGLLSAENGRLFVKCGKGAIEILEIQPEGKRPMGARAFFNGYRWIIGAKLN